VGIIKLEILMEMRDYVLVEIMMIEPSSESLPDFTYWYHQYFDWKNWMGSITASGSQRKSSLYGDILFFYC